MAATIARVLQLSDLHFGVRGQQDVWQKLLRFVRQELQPEAVLLTGDIVDSPKTALFEEAGEALAALRRPYRTAGADVQLLLCPGNHDRFWRGNRLGIPWPVGKQFEYYFGEWFRRQRTVVKLNGGVSLEVTAIDTTESARFFARGFVKSATLDLLARTGATAVDGHERSLRVLLMHHHLLPIAELEPAEGSLLGPFLGATTMVENAGHVLQSLSAGQFDLVLHGHEHAFNLARFDAVQKDSLPITVVSAPSSTGVVTGRPCDLNASRVNVLEIDADETLWLNVHRYDGDRESWASTERHLLMTDLDMRKAWFARSPSAVTRPDVGGRTFFEHTRDFDVRVLRTSCDIEVPENGSVDVKVAASAGRPTSLHCRYIHAGMTKDVGRVPFEESEQRGIFVAHVRLPELVPGQLLERLVVEYVWKDNSQITASRLRKLPEAAHDHFTRQGMDSVFAGTPGRRVAWIEISVLLPFEFAPCAGLGGVQVFVQRTDRLAGGPPLLSDSLTRKIVPSGDGHYSLRIPYPDVNTKYYLAWPVFDDLGGGGAPTTVDEGPVESG